MGPNNVRTFARVNKLLHSILGLWLPDKWSTMTAVATLSLSLSAFFLPWFLSKAGIVLSSENGLRIQTAAPPIVLFVGTLIVLIIVLWHYKAQTPAALDGEIVLDKSKPFLGILALIAKYHSQEIPATPRQIATDLSLDPEITLAHMWKFHNEQFISFRNGGKKPELDTPFFLSHKAWECIKVVESHTIS